MAYAIIKPDHLGDLILSSAAIRAISAVHSDTVLFVASKNVSLAQYLFPGVDVRTIDFRHLSKGSGTDQVPDLRSFETIAFLRADDVITVNWAALRTRSCVLPVDTHAVHQSMIDYTVASWLAGPYDIDAAFYGNRISRVVSKAVATPKRIGISIGSGFHANAWPVLRWLEAARYLLSRADSVTILCGPAEREKAAFLADRLGSPAAVDTVVGGSDIASFVSSVDDLDLIVASDGGTAHLCSLVTPILSVFGPSPFRRYAPYGRLNRLMTRQMVCSPCCQYSTELVNGCLTTECMTQITTQHLARALAIPLTADTNPHRLPPEQGVHVHIGVSHTAREQRITRYHRDAWQAAADYPHLSGRLLPDPSELMNDLQAARLALIDVVERLKYAPDDLYAARVRGIAIQFARLQRANADARQYLTQTGLEQKSTPGTLGGRTQ